MIDVISYLPARRKPSASGWISFNAPCCEHNGESRDRRSRGGIKTSDASWSYHCFNCGYTASFILGRNLSFKARKLMSWLGVPSEEIEHINLESLRHRNMEGLLTDRERTSRTLQGIEFEERKIGDGYTREELLEAVPNARTVPQIFLNNQLIGGFTELKKYIEQTAGGYGKGEI